MILPLNGSTFITSLVFTRRRRDETSHVVVTDGDSYRMKQARARGAASRKAS